MIECRVWRAESPMISIDQGKRSDTLGKPMRHVTPCKGKSPHNMLCFNAFALSWRKLHGTLYPGPSCLGKRQSRAAAVLRTSAPSGAFRLDDAPSFNKKRNRQVGRLAMARMMENKPKFRWAYARLLCFIFIGVSDLGKTG